MVQNGPCPCTFKENICPDDLYWPVRRSSATFPTQFAVIVDGLILKIEKHFIVQQIVFVIEFSCGNLRECFDIDISHSSHL